jgi:hypothetical protein
VSESEAMMKILESPLLGEFVAYLKASWSGRSRVDLRRRRLRQLVTKLRAVTDAAESRGAAASSFAAWLHMLRTEALRGQQVLDASRCDAAAVAGSTRRLLSGLKELVVSSPEVDRLSKAVEELERLAGPGGDLDMFVKVLRLNDPRPAAMMDVDGCRLEEVSGSYCMAFAGTPLPLPGCKRTRAYCSFGASSLPAPGLKRKHACCSSAADSGSTSLDAVDRKRRVLASARPRHWFPTFRGLFGAPRELPPPQAQSARTVALALTRMRRRIGNPTRRRRQATIGRQLSRLSL